MLRCVGVGVLGGDYVDIVEVGKRGEQLTDDVRSRATASLGDATALYVSLSLDVVMVIAVALTFATVKAGTGSTSRLITTLVARSSPVVMVPELRVAPMLSTLL